MGIDRLGKTGPPAPLYGTPGSSPTASTGQAFEVPKPSGPVCDAASAPAAPVVRGPHEAAVQATRGPLERLRAGEIDASGYVDLKVDEATAHLSVLPSAQLEAIRSALRDQLASDPALVDLVQTAVAVGRPPIDE